MRMSIIMSLPVVLLLGASSGNAQPLTGASITPSPSRSPSPSSSPSVHPSSSPSVAPSSVLSPSPIPSPTSTFSPPAVSQRSVYFSKVRPLNNSGVWGDVMIVVDDNSVGALVRAIGLQPGMQHSQYVESGTLCPDQNADQNNDGYIDSVEAANFVGLPFLTLSFSDGSFPIPSESGKVNFIGTVGGNVSTPTPVMSSSTMPLPVSSSPVSSASPTALPVSGTTPNLNNLGGLAVVINGVGSNVQLPSTVQGVNPNADLPVACGRLRQNLE